MSNLSRMDRMALLNSEVYQELENAEINKIAQSLSDKIVNSPGAQQAISNGITKALENNDDDGKMEDVHKEIKNHITKLNDHELYEMSKIFTDALDARGIAPKNFEKEFENEEGEETKADENKEEEDMEHVFAFVKASLTKIAENAADNGNTQAAYAIERFIQKYNRGE